MRESQQPSPYSLSLDHPAQVDIAWAADIITELRDVLGALGVIGNGYCFCSEHRDPHKEQHQPECRLARAALEGEKDVK
jgi:hypothetical protein